MNVAWVNAGVLGLSAYATQVSKQENPAVQSMSTGTLYAGIMYGAFENENLLRTAIIGTACSYVAQTLTAHTDTASQPHDEDGKQDRGYSTDYPHFLSPLGKTETS